MAKKPKQSAFSIVELLIVITIIASLIGLAIPAINMIQQSYNSTGSKNLISSALATARTIAMSRQRYAGIRFQKAYNPDFPDDPTKQNQYMIFVVEDHENTELVWGFSAAERHKPIKLPENIGVIDMKYINGDTDIDDSIDLIDATAFSIIFSPAGKLVIHDVTIRNKDGDASGTGSNDHVFNTYDSITHITDPYGMFAQDEDPANPQADGLEKEPSRTKFLIYNRKEFAGYFDKGDAYLEYLVGLKETFINPYTGTIIER